MLNVWFCSDHHLSHANILTFKNGTGVEHIRNFSSIEEMNETIIQNHNSVVGENDVVYFLGDVSFNKNEMDILLPRMNGKKRLVLGNHDSFKMSHYSAHFKKIKSSWRPVRNMIVTHIPVVLSGNLVNLHGHMHDKMLDDPRYLNVSMEQINYTPVHFDWVVEQFKERGFKV